MIFCNILFFAQAFLIQRARLNGSNQEVLIHSDGLDSDGVAIDWLARNLYWSDAKNNRIEVARLDGSSRKVFFFLSSFKFTSHGGTSPGSTSEIEPAPSSM